MAGESEDETKLDLTRDELERQFLMPYRQGLPITVNGRSIESSNLERVRISKSDVPSADIISTLRDEARRSRTLVLGGPSYAWKAAARAEDITDELITGPPGSDVSSAESHTASDVRLNRVSVPAGPGDGRSVFLVHGRNLPLTKAMIEFLQSLDIRVIEWEQAVQMTGEPNPYIGDVLTVGLENADAILVLASPDDIVRLDPNLATNSNDDELEEARQPRQNVIYEAGMAMALAPGRTLIVAIRGTKIFSDISGRHMAYLDNSPEARRRIIRRLQTTGLAVNDSGDMWLNSGDFSGYGE